MFSWFSSWWATVDPNLSTGSDIPPEPTPAEVVESLTLTEITTLPGLARHAPRNLTELLTQGPQQVRVTDTMLQNIRASLRPVVQSTQKKEYLPRFPLARSISILGLDSKETVSERLAAIKESRTSLVSQEIIL